MAAHTFAPEDALPPPKSTVIYSRDGRKRSLNIDITKHMASSLQDNPMGPSTPLIAATATSPDDAHADTVSGIKGHPTSSDHDGTVAASTSSSHKKKKKKKTKKKALGSIDESSTSSARQQNHQHHVGCRHHHLEDEEEDDEDLYSDEDAYDPETPALGSSASAGVLGANSHVSSSAGTAPAAGAVAITTTAATHPTVNSNSESGSSKKRKKKRKKSSTTRVVPSAPGNGVSSQHNRNHSHGNSGSSSKVMVQSGHRNGHDRSAAVKRLHDSHSQNDGFWHYSDAEERQRIREFWFQLREEERRSLVRVEKEAVLKKMKEQQRHSCSCSLCGRKRTAIEEELELLYDAYYDELEQYANQQQPSDGHALTYPQHSPAFEEDDLSDESRHSDEEDEEGDEEDDDEDDEEGYEDEEEEEEEYDDEVNNRKAPFTYRSGFPNTLQAKGNILTVAEDLLENDGKKFLEMMDRLADRKVQRDDESLDNRGVYEEYDDEEEGEFEDEGAEEDTLTKEQRMEEGRRMFQAFAARMFEQRVLSAYREKVAQERQERLLAELEEESRQVQLREERKEREKEKRRDKKRLQRQQKEEEKTAKEAQRLAEEKQLLEERERKLDADRKRREEERRVKEEEKRQREEERVRKEEERKRKLKEEKAREVEKERKRKDEQLAREQEEQARKLAKEARKTEEDARKAEETAREEARRLEREVYLKQRLAEEQRRQDELRQQEQLTKEELVKQEQTRQELTRQVVVAAAAAAMAASAVNSPPAHVLKSNAPTSPSQDTKAMSDAGMSSASQGSQSRSPIASISTSPIHVPESVSSQPLPAQGPSIPLANNLWANPYPPQGTPQSPLQHIFPQPMQRGMYRPPSHFGHIGDLDAFPARMSHAAGRGAFMGASLQNQSPFQPIPPLQQPSSPLPQQMGGLRSPGLAPMGYGQTNVPAKQLLTLMSPSVVSGNQDLINNSGSPLHSPSTLGAIGTPIGPFGPISPIGHTRRTSTPYGPTSGDTIRPIQRPVPIGRPKDSHHHSASGTIASSFDSLSLGLSGLSIGADLERRPRSPSLNLTGTATLDLDGISLGKESKRVSNPGSDSLTHSHSNDPAHLPPLSPSIRNQRESSFFSNSIFGSRVNGHGKCLHFPPEIT
ncbi:Stress response protein nst1 [Modicella reniformis]|uniref:Stress response protein NST1 n=1 Tax=Modicella reniformis TaxID=1440133 RepID=A0A9P6ST37_9FUNG|nr:Stress response protein nst1 [Modicella reniformis]